MKPIIPNPKRPNEVCKKQLAELDNYIKTILPNATLKEGCKYARWAEVNGLVDYPETSPGVRTLVGPDNIFSGKMLGKEVTIFMWMPFFDQNETN